MCLIRLQKIIYNHWQSGLKKFVLEKISRLQINSKSVRPIEVIPIILAIVIALVCDYLCTIHLAWKGLNDIRDDLVFIFQSQQTQWIVVLGFIVYLAVLLPARKPDARKINGRCRHFGRGTGIKSFLFAIIIIFGASRYAASCSQPTATTFVTFIYAAAVARTVAILYSHQTEPGKIFFARGYFVLYLLTVGVAACLHSGAWQYSNYHGQIRWTGPWENPNTYGSLTAVGVVISLGLMLNTMDRMRCQIVLARQPARDPAVSTIWIITMLCTLIVMLVRLIHSYSRGGWLGAFCGGLILLSYWYSHSRPALVRRINLNVLPLAFVIASALVLSFWQCRKADFLPLTRVLSSVNMNDLSSRNRIDAWVGDLQIMADHLWGGFGWNEVKPLYGSYYLQSKLNEDTAIVTNDYLLFGSMLGVPAFICFLTYLWLSLTTKLKTINKNQKSEDIESGWMIAICRAGTAVLLVAFWFDGGLFKLATASTFWILLELLNAQNRECAWSNIHD